jgi:hypothetical protein
VEAPAPEALPTRSGGLPDGVEAADAGTGDAAVIAVGEGAKSGVDPLGEFGEVEREGAGSLHRAGIHQDEVVGADVGGHGGIAGFGLGVVAVEPIDHGIPLLGLGVVRRKIHAIRAGAIHDLAAVAQILNHGGSLKGRGGAACQQEEEENAHT